jgi:predicted DNA-binding transcriptional regulator AlpA
MYRPKEEDRLLSTKEVAGVLGCSAASLERGRCYDYGPPYRKIGRLVRYLLSDVVAFRDASIVHPGRRAA